MTVCVRHPCSATPDPDLLQRTLHADAVWRSTARVFVEPVRCSHTGHHDVTGHERGPYLPRTPPGPRSTGLARRRACLLPLGLRCQSRPGCSATPPPRPVRRPRHAVSAVRPGSSTESATTQGTATADNAVVHVFHQAAREAGLHPQIEKAGVPQHHPESDGLPQRTSFHPPVDCGSTTEKTRSQKHGILRSLLASLRLAEPRPIDDDDPEPDGMRDAQERNPCHTSGLRQPRRRRSDSARTFGHLDLPKAQLNLPPHTKWHQSRTGSAHLFNISP